MKRISISSLDRLYLRRAFLLAALTLSASVLPAADSLTSATLANWKSSGQPTDAGTGKGLVITAGAELSRSFPVNQLAVRVVSRPFFGSSQEGWPTLEVGPASLTFIRDANGGAMVLLGDQALMLPTTIDLDREGRSAQLLDFTFGYDVSTQVATLQLGAHKYLRPAVAVAGRLDVVISAGREASWSLDVLTVEAGATVPEKPTAIVPKAPPEKSSAGKTSSVVQNRPSAAERKAEITKAHEIASALFAVGKDAQAEQALTAVSRLKKESAGWHLEAAGLLVQESFLLNRNLDAPGAGRVARRALQHTVDAAAKAKRGENDLAASALKMAAFIHERMLGDYSAAKRSAIAAKAAVPTDPDADRILKRLERVEAEAARKDSNSAKKGT